MDDVGRVSFEVNINQLAEAVQELSKQIQELQQTTREESERFEKLKEGDALLEFTLVTGGFIVGEILWIGNSSLGIKTDSGQNVILYKHAIAFVQEQAE
ncbi:hypothetical protein ACFL6S_34180 [Candidatus Poribacteria bacterium]